MSTASNEIAELRPPSEKAMETLKGGAYITPQDWATLSAMASTMASTEFVPKGLRNRPAAVLSCLLYGRDLGLRPTVALQSVYIVDGKPTLAGSQYLSQIRKAGHTIRREQHLDEHGNIVGVTAHGKRGDSDEEESETFTLKMAERAGLYPKKDNWRMYPERMMWWRAVSGLALILFSDVFLGMPLHMPEEVEPETSVDAGARGVAAAPDSGPTLDYGPDPAIGSRLMQLFEAVDAIDATAFRKAKKATLLRECENEDDRLRLAATLEAWLTEHGAAIPEPFIDADGNEIVFGDEAAERGAA